ncbi:hypothetical protein BpHYR1_045082 [Brachionus plicatilis]|uniref:Uncharacterized protein n=1 Tax=Brachionus plicatilis TaxID=10195 RepID=A0A3M7PPJ8_BRAPC|nr:hypothetical protein BpHYR1_045082 [Brachionus plicatilis]
MFEPLSHTPQSTFVDWKRRLAKILLFHSNRGSDRNHPYRRKHFMPKSTGWYRNLENPHQGAVPIVEFGYRICLGGRLLSKHFDHLFFQFEPIHRSLINSEFEPPQTIAVQKGGNTIPQISFYYLVVFVQ